MNLKRVFEKKLRDVELVVTGKVVRLLKDDTEGTPHQRWILEDDNGNSVMVVYNIARFERLDISVGMKMEVKGIYVWAEEGGFIHHVHPRVHEHDQFVGYVSLLK